MMATKAEFWLIYQKRPHQREPQQQFVESC